MKPEAAMNASSQSSTELDAILRNQEALLCNQQRLEQKLDQILAFASLLSLAIHTLTTASPVIPVQPTTSASALIAVPFALSSPAAGDQPQSDEEGLSTDNLFQLSKKARSRANFAVQLLKELFEPSELEGRNIAGTHGKERVDPEKIEQIKTEVHKYYPVATADIDSRWQDC
ncbi:hypothetical protein OS493_007037 [Desmophyllum pertusum]|uniref:Uncharacterized protein n=1 Tax=Desmophyllum pertusum TaxID=174260 RepID=A0A9W9ZFD8_9CNID|nr:hypothetical protein OS493_007037 [Desmophyllum pertusum]